MLPHIQDYAELYRKFRWQIPARYNIGIDICDRWAQSNPDRLALVNVLADGRVWNGLRRLRKDNTGYDLIPTIAIETVLHCVAADMELVAGARHGDIKLAAILFHDASALLSAPLRECPRLHASSSRSPRRA